MEYSVGLPYPAIVVRNQNRAYGRAMLSNIGGCTSCFTTIGACYYYSTMTAREYKEVSEVFRRISVVENRHLDIFGQLCLLLGTDPRICECRNSRRTYWNGSYVNYQQDLYSILKSALYLTEDTIKKYRRQAQWIDDPGIVAILNRFILDKQQHVKIFKELLARC